MVNNTTSDIVSEALPFSTPIASLIGFLIGVVIFVTVTGNVLVIIAFITDKSIRNFSDFLVLNLAISDFVIGIICIPFYAPYLLLGRWPFGRVFCLVWISMDYVTPAASAIGMSVISFDRYLQIGHPLWTRTNRTNKLLAVFIVIPWILPAMFFIPAISLWEIVNGRVIPEGQCFLPYNQSFTLLMLGTIVEFIIPFIVVLIFNFLVYYNIRQRNKKNNVTQDTRQTDQSTNHNTTKVSQQIKDKKAARALFILIAVFGICWCPFEMTALVQTICGGCVGAVFFEIVFWMLWMNSLINPLLYPFLHSRYRKAFFKLIKYRPLNIQPSETINATVATHD